MIPVATPFEPLSRMRHLFEVHGVVVVRGLFLPEEVIEVREHLKATFSPARDSAEPAGPGKRVQRLRISTDAPLPQIVRGLWEPPTRDLFQRLIELRNFLTGQPPRWAEEPEDGWWTGCRFNQYPVGGGFMAQHTDGEYLGNDLPPGGYAQPLLLMTQKGVDFQHGGGFVCRNGVWEDVDVQCGIGDVLVYDAAIPHEVRPIDFRLPLDLTTFSGRIVAAVTPLKVLP